MEKLLHFSAVQVAAAVNDLAGVKACVESEVNVTRGIGMESPTCLAKDLQKGNVAVGDAGEVEACVRMRDGLRDVLNGLVEAIAIIDIQR